MPINNIAFNNFPSEFVPKEIKEGNSYGLQYAQAIWGNYTINNGTNYINNTTSYEFLRSVAAGRQSVSGITGLLGYNNANESTISSREVDVQILNFGKMFVESAVSKMLRRNYDFTASVIDPSAVNKQKKREAILKAFYEVSRLADVQLAKELFPDIDTSLLEETEEETLLKAQMTFSQELCMEADVAIKLLTQLINDIKEVRRQVAEDLVTVGIGGTKVYLDENKIPRLRRVRPENFVYSHVDDAKLDKISYAGEVEFLQVADFIRESAAYLTPDEQETIIGTYGTNQPYFVFDVNGRYVYSNTQTNKYIPVLRFQFLSTNVEVFEIKTNKIGNKRMYRKDFYYNPTKEYQEKYTNREVVRTGIIDKYGGNYIVGSDYVYGYRCIEGPVQNLVNKRLDYNMYAPSIYQGITTSITSQMVEPLTMINICHNRIKEIVGLGREGVLELDTSMLAQLTLGSEKVSAKQALSLLYRDKILLTKSQNSDGELTVVNQKRAVAEIPIGLRLADIAGVMDRAISYLRQLTGVNPGLAAPEKGTGLGQTEIAVSAVDDALGGLYHADQQIMKMTYESLLGMWQVASMYGREFEGVIDALGDGTYKFWRTNKNMAYSNFGLILELAPTDAQWESLYAAMAQAQKEGLISPSQYIALQDYKTFKMAQQMFILHEKRGERKRQEMARINSEMQSKANQEAVMAKGQMDLQFLQAETQSKQMLEQQKHQYKMEELTLQIQGNIRVAEVGLSKSVEVQNRANFGKAVSTELTNKALIEKERIKNGSQQGISDTSNE